MDETRVTGIVFRSATLPGRLRESKFHGSGSGDRRIVIDPWALTGKIQWLRYLEASIAVLALWLTWSSGARSAMIAFLTGIVLMNYFYRTRLSKKTVLITLLTTFFMVAMPDLPKNARLVLLRGEKTSDSFSEQIFKTRKDVWSAAWEGFQDRPFLGWGFGADDTMSKEWNVQFTALGTVSRDNVNDTMIVLESTGVVGLMAYLLLILAALKQIPTRYQRWMLHQASSSLGRLIFLYIISMPSHTF